MIDFKELQAVLDEFAAAMIDEYRANLARDNRNASGKLTETITSNVKAGSKEYVVSLNLKEYWKYIEYGTKGRKTGNPGRKFPPVNKLLEWVQVKPGLPRPATLKGQQDLARRIAGKVYWYGTQGKPSLADAKQTNIDRFRQRISEALGHDMRDYIVKVLAK